MRLPNSLTRVWQRLVENESGSYTIIFALSMIPLLACAGLAVDFGRANSLRDELQRSVDGAVLAAARKANLSEPELKAFAQSYLAANTQLDLASTDIVLTKTSTGVSLSAKANIDTYIMPVLGYESLELQAYSEVMIGLGDIEVALMLDVTGSMCADGEGPCTASPKLTGLKTAAQELVNIIITGDQSDRTTRVSLIPFSTRVRVARDGQGGSLMTAMTGLSDRWTGWYEYCSASSGSGGSEGGGNWTCSATTTAHMSNWKIMPCVTDRFFNDPWDNGETDAAPGPGNWLNAHGGDRAPASWDSTDTPLADHTGQNPGDPSTNWNYSSDGYCSDVAEANVMMPLTSDKAALNTRIAGLEAYGATGGSLGTQMAWYTLSPNWNGVFTGASAPGSYAELADDPITGVPRLQKVAVLMTDGVYNTYRGWKDADQQTVSDWSLEVCTNMKAAGIEVYTVGFALDELTPAERLIAEDTLRDCSTDAMTHYYDADTVAELTQAFQTIGSKLSALRITR